ncbi:hypothetical protein CQA44_12360, partial [Helicobacter sp. MIT 14-3879]
KYYDRIFSSFRFVFKNNNVKRDNIEKIIFYVNWDKIRPYLSGNEGTGFHLGTVPLDCDYFKYKGYKRIIGKYSN